MPYSNKPNTNPYHWQDTRRCDWESFEGREELLKSVSTLSAVVKKVRLDQRRRTVRRNNGIIVPPSWIIETIGHELSVDSETALHHWRKNKGEYPSPSQWKELDEYLQEEGLILHMY